MRKLLNIILVCSLLFSSYKVVDYKHKLEQSEKMYAELRQQKENNEEKISIDIEEELNEEYEVEYKEFDWIKIPNTNIEYPIAYGKGDDYYLTHDIKDNESNSGSIFYSDDDEPLVGTNTTIYGHCMKNGTMFADLQQFKDKEKFMNSTLTLETLVEEKEFKPLAVYITNNDFFHSYLDNFTTYEALDIIKEKALIYNDLQYSEDAHILTLVTCEYSEEGNRLLVFYIED